MKKLIIALAFAGCLAAQSTPQNTLVVSAPYWTPGSLTNVDLSGTATVKPFRSVNALPGTCSSTGEAATHRYRGIYLRCI